MNIKRQCLASLSSAWHPRAEGELSHSHGKQMSTVHKQVRNHRDI